MMRAGKDLTIINEASRKSSDTDSQQSYLPRALYTSWAIRTHFVFLADCCQTLWSGDNFRSFTSLLKRSEGRHPVVETVQGASSHSRILAPYSPHPRNSSRPLMELTMVFRSTLTTFSPNIAVARIFQAAWAGLIQPGMSLSTLKQLMYALSFMPSVPM